jgi:hypothetical protein
MEIEHGLAGNTREMLTRTVRDTITSPESVGTRDTSIRVVDKNAGLDVLLVKTPTNCDGRYTVSFSAALASWRARDNTNIDLQARMSLVLTFLAVTERHGWQCCDSAPEPSAAARLRHPQGGAVARAVRPQHAPGRTPSYEGTTDQILTLPLQAR